MRKTEYYNLDVLEGSDKANIPISQAPNITTIDEQMHTNASNGFSPATELLNGMVHNLTRQVPDAGMIRWIATAPYAAGDTFTVDGEAVTARTVSGENLPSGAYIIGQCVQAFVDGANMTVFVDSKNAQLFNNRPATWYQQNINNTSRGVAFGMEQEVHYNDRGIYFLENYHNITKNHPGINFESPLFYTINGVLCINFIHEFIQQLNNGKNFVVYIRYRDTDNWTKAHQISGWFKEKSVTIPWYKDMQVAFVCDQLTAMNDTVCIINSVAYYMI